MGLGNSGFAGEVLILTISLRIHFSFSAHLLVRHDVTASPRADSIERPR